MLNLVLKLKQTKIVWIVLLISISVCLSSQDKEPKKDTSDKEKIDINQAINKLDSISSSNQEYIRILDSLNKARK